MTAAAASIARNVAMNVIICCCVLSFRYLFHVDFTALITKAMHTASGIPALANARIMCVCIIFSLPITAMGR